MPTGLGTLETLLGKPPVNNGNGHALIFFTNALGETVQVLPGKFPTDQLGSGNNDYHPEETSASEVDGFNFYIVPSLQKDQQRLAEVQRGLAHRQKVRQWRQDNNHHFGGYHLGKNNRQRRPLSDLDGLLGDIFDAAELFGVPYWVLDLTQARLQQLAEQRGLEEQFNWAARAAQRTYGNGR